MRERGLRVLAKIQLSVLAVIASGAVAVNLFLAPQIYNPRPPAFNGPQLAETERWAGMAREMHAWWIADRFPNATLLHAGQIRPPGSPDAFAAGIRIADWSTEFLPLTIDTSTAAVDVSNLRIRDTLFAKRQLTGAIPCHADALDPASGGWTCAYFIAWDDDLLSETPPVFIGARTIADGSGNYEVAFVEKSLLESIVGSPHQSLPTVADPQ